MVHGVLELAGRGEIDPALDAFAITSAAEQTGCRVQGAGSGFVGLAPPRGQEWANFVVFEYRVSASPVRELGLPWSSTGALWSHNTDRGPVPRRAGYRRNFGSCSTRRPIVAFASKYWMTT